MPRVKFTVNSNTKPTAVKGTVPTLKQVKAVATPQVKAVVSPKKPRVVKQRDYLMLVDVKINKNLLNAINSRINDIVEKVIYTTSGDQVDVEEVKDQVMEELAEAHTCKVCGAITEETVDDMFYFCSKHMKQNESKSFCTFVMRTGQNKGKMCGKYITLPKDHDGDYGEYVESMNYMCQQHYNTAPQCEHMIKDVQCSKNSVGEPIEFDDGSTKYLCNTHNPNTPKANTTNTCQAVRQSDGKGCGSKVKQGQQYCNKHPDGIIKEQPIKYHCAKILDSGNQCRLLVEKEGDHCKKHQDVMVTAVSNAQPRCKGVCKNGTQCTKRSVAGFEYCTTHKQSVEVEEVDPSQDDVLQVDTTTTVVEPVEEQAVEDVVEVGKKVGTKTKPLQPNAPKTRKRPSKQ